jgi:hypothetical protein
MKKTLILLLTTLSFYALAEPITKNKRVICDDTTTLINAMVNGEYKENPVWSGLDIESETKYGLLMNSKTGTWTIIQFDEKMACVLGVGEEAKSLMIGSKNVKQH